MGRGLSIFVFSVFAFRILIRPSVDFNTIQTALVKKDLDSLIEAYNKMVEQLRQERAYQQEQNNLLQKVFAASPAGIMLLDLDGRVSTVNPAVQRILGQELTALQDRVLHTLAPPFGKELDSLPIDQVKIIQAQGTRLYRCIKSKFVHRGFERQFIMIEELTEEIQKLKNRHMIR